VAADSYHCIIVFKNESDTVHYAQRIRRLKRFCVIYGVLCIHTTKFQLDRPFALYTVREVLSFVVVVVVVVDDDDDDNVMF